MSELAIFQQDVGTWDVDIELRLPGQPAQRSRGVCVKRLISGGVWLISDLRNETSGFEGHGVYGYDPAKKKYVGTWVDDARRFLVAGEGTWDEAAQTMSFESVAELPGRTLRWRDVTEYVDADTQVFHNFVRMADGNELEMTTATYRRRKAR